MKRKLQEKREYEKTNFDIKIYQEISAFLIQSVNPSSIIPQYKQFHFLNNNIVVSSDGNIESIVFFPHGFSEFSIEGGLFKSLIDSFSVEDDVELKIEKEEMIIYRGKKKAGTLLINTDSFLGIDRLSCFSYCDRGFMKCIDGKALVNVFKKLSYFGVDTDLGGSFGYAYLDLGESFALSSDGYRALILSLDNVIEEKKGRVFIPGKLVNSLTNINSYFYDDKVIIFFSLLGEEKIKAFRGSIQKEENKEELDEIINCFSDPRSLLSELNTESTSILEKEIDRLGLFSNIENSISFTFNFDGLFMSSVDSLIGKWEGYIKGENKEGSFYIKLKYLKDLIKVLDKDESIKLYDSERLIAFEQGDMEGIISKMEA